MHPGSSKHSLFIGFCCLPTRQQPSGALLKIFLYSIYDDMLAIVLRIKVGIIELSEDTRISVNFYSFSRSHEPQVTFPCVNYGGRHR